MSDVVVFGGTAESGTICSDLCCGGASVLLCTATAEKLSLPDLPGLERHCGRLEPEGMHKLITSCGCRLVICAVHPYAQAARKNIISASDKCSIPCLNYLRPATMVYANSSNIIHTSSHTEAAEIACSFGCPVFLTTGSRNAGIYLQQARQKHIPVLARVLDSHNVRVDMLRQGFSEDECIFARGPFSIGQNREHIRMIKARVLVTKDGGETGGLPQKVTAATEEKCKLIIVDRPQESLHLVECFHDTAPLTSRALEIISNSSD